MTSTILVADPMSHQDEQLTVIARATEEFLEAIRQRTESPVEELIHEYAEKYSNVRDQIEDLFPALVGVEKIARVNPASEKPGGPDSFPTLGDYEIIREIGRGGMGIVYEARQKSLDRQVALKTLSLDVDSHPAFLERFQREAKTAASLHHTNIVPIYDVGCENGVHFFSMQYIAGTNLADLCKKFRETAMGIDEATLKFRGADQHSNSTQEIAGLQTSAITRYDLRSESSWSGKTRRPSDHSFDHLEVSKIGAQIADALAYIHDRGIVHRDIKPSNILLDKDGNAWLADWGLVKSGFSELTQTGDLFGSLAYMAPERFKGTSDPRSDIYSLGVTLYELLTLRRLFPVQDQAELVSLIVNAQPTQPTDLVPELSVDFETVILKSIDKQPDARYETATAFADDLRRVTNGHPVSARRISLLERGTRWCRRKPVLAGLVGLATFLLITGTIVSSWFAVQANRAKQQASLREQQSEESLDVFFGTFFPQAGPDQSAPMSVEFRAAMDKAVNKIMVESNYDPVVIGKLFNRLGWIYFNQQDYQRALDVFQHANRTVSDAHEETHPVAMQAIDRIGMTLMRMDHNEESEKYLLKAWMLQTEILGADHVNTIHAYAKLGDLYQQMGRFDESIKITKEVLKIRQRPGRDDNAFALVSKNGLANAYIQKEMPQSAIDLLESVIAEREANASSSELGISYNLQNLARAYREKGDLKQAQLLNNRSLALRLKFLAPNSDSCLSSRAFAAGVLAELGDPETALDTLLQVWSDAKDTQLHVRKGMILLELGLCLKQLNRMDEAVVELEKAKKTLEKYRSRNYLYAKKAIRALEEINMTVHNLKVKEASE